MTAFTIERHVPASPQEVWERVTDFASHGDWVPLTRMRTDDGPPRLGWEFAGVTGLGPLSFSDTMLVTRWEPPRAFRVVKTGRLVEGWAEAELNEAAGGTLLHWTEDLGVRSVLARPLRPLTDRIGRKQAERILDRMLAGLGDPAADGRRD